MTHFICGRCEHEWPGPGDGPCPKCGNKFEDHVLVAQRLPPRCSRCGRFCAVVERAPPGESGDLYACTCDGGRR